MSKAFNIHQDGLDGRYVQMDQVEWVDFPAALCEGPIKWKLLNVSPELGSWTAIFDCPAETSFNRHIYSDILNLISLIHLCSQLQRSVYLIYIRHLSQID